MFRKLVVNKPTDEHESLQVKNRNKPFHYIILFLVISNITLIVINAGIWIMADFQKLFVAADFTSFYTGYYMVRVGEGENLYDAAIQSKYQQEFMAGRTFEGGVLLFPNPPYVAILLSPISLLPLNIAFYLWSLIQMSLLIWMLFSFNRLFSHWDKLERVILLIAILAFWPLTNTFMLGQFSLLLLIGLLQMYIAMKNSTLTQAGFWLSLLTIKPHTLLIPGMMTLNRRYWRVAVIILVIGISLFIGSWLIIGSQPWIQYIQSLKTLSSYFGEYGVHPNTEYTIRGVLSNLLGGSQADFINIISILVLLVGMIYVWFLWRKGISQNSPRFMLYFAFTVLLSVFLSLHLNPHDSLLLVLPAALFYDYLRGLNLPRRVYSILLLVSPPVFLIAAFNNYNLFGIFRPPVIVILILLAWMIYYLIRDHRKDQEKSIITIPT